MYNRLTRRSSTIFFIIFLLSVGTFYPFVHNYVFFGNFKTVGSLFFLAIWIALIPGYNIRVVLPHRNFNLIVLVQLIYFICYSVYWQSSDIYTTVYYLVLSWLFLVLVLSTFTVEQFFSNFIKFNIVSGVFCLVGTILFAFGYLKVLGVFDYQGDFKIYNLGWFFMKRSNEFAHQLRPAGYYDEPGSFAYVAMFLILINRKYFRNMRWEYALIFLPMLTTSMAHIFSVILFFCLFYVNRKNIKYAIGALLIISGAVFMLTSGILSEENTRYFKQRTIDRVIGFIEGEEDASRQGGLELGPEIFEKYPFGRPKELVLSEFPGFVSETLWGPIIYYGILFFPLYILPFIYVFFKSFGKNDVFILASLVLVAANLLQRPYYMYPLWLILIYYLFFYEKKEGKSYV